jgi:hypothetical protein
MTRRRSTDPRKHRDWRRLSEETRLDSMIDIEPLPTRHEHGRACIVEDYRRYIAARAERALAMAERPVELQSPKKRRKALSRARSNAR